MSTARHRCVDALNRVDQYAQGWEEGSDVALRHAVEALTWVLQHPAEVTPERLEHHIANMCAAVGVDGP